jgi:membrane protein involved in colicin uptake
MADVDLSERVASIAARAKVKSEQAAADQAVRDRQQADQVEARRAALRAAMPEIAGVVDQLRDVFGDVEVLIAEEGGKQVVAEKRLKALGLYHGYVGK